MAQDTNGLNATIRGYVAELERLGVPVAHVILYGSQVRGQAHTDSDIDLAVFSYRFGQADHLEFSGILSKAKWHSAAAIEALGFHPSSLANPPKASLLGEIVRTGRRFDFAKA